MNLAVVALGLWLAIGVGIGVVMWRRGYDGWAWLLVGVFMGPLAIAPAIARRIPPRAYERLEDAGRVDVLVGFDGSDESRAAVAAATRLLGPRLGRLTVATAVPIDVSPRSARLTRTVLNEAVEKLAPTASVELVEGRPADALLACATQAGYEVIVIGTRGAGLAKHALGSVARELSQSSKVPVLLIPSGGSATPPDPAA